MTPAERAVIDAARAYADMEDSGTLDRIQKALNELDAESVRVIDVRDFVEKAMALDARAGFLARRLLDPVSYPRSAVPGSQWGRYATVRQLATADFRDLIAIRNMGPGTLAFLALALEQVGLDPEWARRMPPKFAAALKAKRSQP